MLGLKLNRVSKRGPWYLHLYADSQIRESVFRKLNTTAFVFVLIVRVLCIWKIFQNILYHETIYAGVGHVI